MSRRRRRAAPTRDGFGRRRLDGRLRHLGGAAPDRSAAAGSAAAGVAGLGLLDQVGEQQHVVAGGCRLRPRLERRHDARPAGLARRLLAGHLGARLVVGDDLADRRQDVVHRGVVVGALGVAHHLLPKPPLVVSSGPAPAACRVAGAPADPARADLVIIPLFVIILDRQCQACAPSAGRCRPARRSRPPARRGGPATRLTWEFSSSCSAFNTSRVVREPTRASWRTPFKATSLARTCASNEVTRERDESSWRQARITFSAAARRALSSSLRRWPTSSLAWRIARPFAAVLVDRHRRLHAHAVVVVLVGRDLQVELLYWMKPTRLTWGSRSPTALFTP